MVWGTPDEMAGLMLSGYELGSICWITPLGTPWESRP